MFFTYICHFTTLRIMISICIPVYNFDMTRLVNDLHKQAGMLDAEIDILLLDDASSPAYKETNRKLANLNRVRYKELETNVGRSKIRNLLSKKARHPFLLFMDCDSQVPDKHYLERYLQQLDPGREAIIYGGRTYAPEPDRAENRLHWLFGSKREVKTAETRKKHPYQSFMSNNFLIPKTILSENPFNEQLSGYGHEDTLMGYELKKKQLPIIHIDNPLMHIGLETAEEFLHKNEEGLQNLLKISDFLNNDEVFIKMVKVMRSCRVLKRFYLRKPFIFVFNLFEKRIKQVLMGASPKLWYLDVYKLGRLCKIRRII